MTFIPFSFVVIFFPLKTVYKTKYSPPVFGLKIVGFFDGGSRMAPSPRTRIRDFPPSFIHFLCISISFSRSYFAAPMYAVIALPPNFVLPSPGLNPTGLPNGCSSHKADLSLTKEFDIGESTADPNDPGVNSTGEYTEYLLNKNNPLAPPLYFVALHFFCSRDWVLSLIVVGFACLATSGHFFSLQMPHFENPYLAPSHWEALNFETRLKDPLQAAWPQFGRNVGKLIRLLDLLPRTFPPPHYLDPRMFFLGLEFIIFLGSWPPTSLACQNTLHEFLFCGLNKSSWVPWSPPMTQASHLGRGRCASAHLFHRLLCCWTIEGC